MQFLSGWVCTKVVYWSGRPPSHPFLEPLHFTSFSAVCCAACQFFFHPVEKNSLSFSLHALCRHRRLLPPHFSHSCAPLFFPALRCRAAGKKASTPGQRAPPPPCHNHPAYMQPLIYTQQQHASREISRFLFLLFILFDHAYWRESVAWLPLLFYSACSFFRIHQDSWELSI